MEADTTTSSASPAVVPVCSSPSLVEDAQGQQQKQQQLKRKADQANLGHVVPKAAPALSAPACPIKKSNNNSTLPRQGSCPDNAISLDDSSTEEEEEETDVPVQSSTTTVAVQSAPPLVMPASVTPTPPLVMNRSARVIGGLETPATVPTQETKAAIYASTQSRMLPTLDPEIKPTELSSNGLAMVPNLGMTKDVAPVTGVAKPETEAVRLHCGDSPAKRENDRAKGKATTGSPGTRRRIGRPTNSKLRSNNGDPRYGAQNSQKVRHLVKELPRYLFNCGTPGYKAIGMTRF